MINIKRKSSEKIFCIGRNKTGTTSLELVLQEFGYKLGDQKRGEKLLKYYKSYEWKPIIKFCNTADAFQDAPFSWPYTWLILQEHFPEAKFILTTRNEEEWYESLTRFHSKLFADGEKAPTKEQLKNADYCYKGFLWEVNRAVWKTPENDLYNKKQLLENYNIHNKSVLNFFKERKNFLHLDVSERGAYQKLAAFLDKKPLHQDFPHLNKTRSL